MVEKNSSSKQESIDDIMARAIGLMKKHGFKQLPTYGKFVSLGESSLRLKITNLPGGFTEFRKRLGEEPSVGKWDLEYTIEQAKLMMNLNKLTQLPSQKKLDKLGHGRLASAINRQGGFQKFRKLLGQDPLKKESGMWKNEDFAVEYAERLKNRYNLDCLPSEGGLCAIGESGLANAISDYHGGFNKFRIRLGEPDWRNLSYSLEYARKLKEKHKLEYLPNTATLKKMGEGSFLYYIVTHHGGITEFRKKLGEKVRDWTDFSYTLEYARELKIKYNLDRLPNSEELDKLGESSLRAAIIEEHGGFEKIRESLGENSQEAKKKLRIGPKGSIMGWKNQEAVIQYIMQLIKRKGLDALPSSARKLESLGEGRLVAAINRYHGGYVKFKEKLKELRIKIEEPIGKKWKLDYILKISKEAMEKYHLEKLPPHRSLVKLGYSGLASAISQYPGGYYEIRTLLGEEWARGSSKNIDYITQKVVSIMEKHNLQDLPSRLELRRLGYGVIGDAIAVNHGGFLAFRERLSQIHAIKSEKEKLEDLLRGFIES